MKLHPTHKAGPLGKRVPWRYCEQCGLVFLKNSVTKEAMRRTCPDREQKQEHERG